MQFCVRNQHRTSSHSRLLVTGTPAPKTSYHRALLISFTGIYALFSQLGVISERTKIAGASSGGLMALAHCSGLAPQLPTLVRDLSALCRQRANCQTSLDRVVRETFEKAIPPDAYERCTDVGYVSITSGKFPSMPAENMLVSAYSSNKEVIDAAAATSYIPLWSGRNTTTRFRGRESYDGFFSNPQPCPPNVGYCIRISSANPPWDKTNWGPLLNVVARASSLYTGRKPPLAATPAGGFKSQTSAAYPNVTAYLQAAAAGVDIAPGIFTNIGMSSNDWMNLVVLPGDEGINRQLYRLGRQDAKAWADATGLTAAARRRRAAAPGDDELAP